MTQEKNSENTNQTSPPRQPLTDEKIKEIIIETLIELGLVPEAQKKKVITTA